MAPLSLARWTAFELLRRPGTWVVLAALGLAWPAVAAFGPLGITTRDGPLTGHLYEVAFLAILFGVTSGAEVLARSSWFLERTDPGRRLGAEAGAIAGACCAPLVAALVPALFVARESSGVGSPGLILAVAWTFIHTTAVGLLVLRLPVTPAVRALAVPLSAWILPALAAVPPGEGSHLARATLCNLLDASRHGKGQAEELTDWVQRGAALLPMMALVIAAWQLTARAPSVHALRNPR